MLKPEEYIADWPDMDYPNFIAWLDGIEKKYSDTRAILSRTGKQTEFSLLTYKQLADESRRIARGLLALGLKKGDRVALWAENRPEWMIVWLGTVIAGLVIVPIDFTVSEKECANILKMANPRAFFYSSRKQDFAASLSSMGVSLDALIVLGHEGGQNFYSFGKDNVSQTLPAVSEIDAHDPVSIIFTSGTTGLAKGVMLHHKGIIANANAAVRSLRAYNWDVFINVLPLHHTYPTTCSFISPLSVGAGIIIVEKLVGKVVIDDIRDGGGTFLIAVPILYDKVMAGIKHGFTQQPKIVQKLISLLRKITTFFNKRKFPQFGKAALKSIRKKIGLDSVRIMVAGGGPLNPKTADFFDSLGFCIVHGYGMSENSPLISVNTPWHKNNVSVGLAVKYTDVKIIDRDADGVGEIAVKSPSLMLGYYENPEATAEVFTQDGFLRTGDLGFMDKYGFIFINGRKKNLIVSSGGKNIYPEEIETCFEGSRVVGEILVAGRREAESGAEQIVAMVYPNMEALAEDYPGKSLDGQFIHDLVKKEIEQANRTLVAFKKIADFKIVNEEFEKNAQKKIKRYLYKDLVNS
ncbi:AMP-dependent synthetase/ligase [Breznakiella homolactica]|uniref:AMP-binding protein n=1 Tax=Breznakiella homolactica TaxID=2798577 RepID=A0A7T8B8X7_9SPIR|nr:AMP-binding protein [Breznakiella homolactica]QQO09079.1 AMP-binding protein [Breznakiella homolactica]